LKNKPLINTMAQISTDLLLRDQSCSFGSLPKVVVDRPDRPIPERAK
jgi:hypothetical protein